jgi:hypothetical protein
MRVTRGNQHDYLGMGLDYTIHGEVKVTMAEYLKGVIQEFPEVITGTATSPAADHLFDVRYDQERPPPKEGMKSRSTNQWHSCSSPVPDQEKIYKRLWHALPCASEALARVIGGGGSNEF